MKSGLTIVEMAQQIERQSKLKQDYLLDTRRLQVEPFGSQLYLHTFDDHDDPLVEPLEINQIAHRQIGTHLKIPAAYYDRMLSDYPELLAENVNSWFQREPTQRMVRTLDGTVRAFLSNRYRRIDNLDIAEIVLPVIQQMEDAYFESCQITDSRMYIKVVNKRLEAEVVPGDIVQSGVIISNSEVGLGSVKACKNMRVLYLLRSGEYMPLQVNLPPTSIKPFKEFLNRAFMLRRRATYGSIVQIGLKRENNGTNDYSVATFKLLQDFQGEELAQIRAYANSFKEQIKLLLQQRAEITEEQRDTGCDYVIEPGAMTNEPADGHYTVSQINGDCEQLPA